MLLQRLYGSGISYYICIYKITAFLKVETDIITESLLEQAAMLVIIFVETFKTDVIVLIGNIIMCLTLR